jgi:hypothetical protein
MTENTRRWRESLRAPGLEHGRIVAAAAGGGIQSVDAIEDRVRVELGALDDV